MAKSRTNKDRKQNVNNYKSKHKKPMSKKQQELDPSVKTSPYWAGDANITLFGAEWDAIFNFINSVAPAYAACSSVMNRGVLEGTVKVRFERQDPTTGEVTPLSPEEEVPYQQQFQETIKQAKEIAAQAVKKVNETADQENQPDYPSQEGLPVLDALVDPNGNAVSSEKLSRGGGELTQAGFPPLRSV